MDPTKPVLVSQLRGTVVQDDYAAGSKSARRAVFLETARGRFLLRRKTGPVFGDETLEPYVGQVVECDGFLIGTTFLAERIEADGSG